ncbi:MAG: DUF2179 domain-containing protein [Deltaproteobacteria bacterium]|jgi:uncharacterized protein YebE (UPF0316 family)|nr:DUF2179 domain-containing protein [Deltaproteobacteria bacterium]MCW8893025.1 DUF2179 domain-containing protein [Deltaproteobacteria bacterium]MCW9049006.1 DUF2179 domain-containing protein [Deltaproteobacteria bacterium]
MEFSQDSTTYAFIIIPVLVFLARILDVSIGTLRIIFVAKGLKSLAALLGFFEALIWLVAVAQVMQNLNSWQTYIAFSLGFATGNYVGIFLEERLALGNLLIRVITRHEANELVQVLRDKGYGVTSIDAQGETGPVKVIFSVVKRKKLTQIIALIKKYNPKAFYTIEDMRYVNGAYLPPILKRTLFPQLAFGKRK